MKIDTQTTIDEYASLLEQIRERFGDDADAMIVLQEIRKDTRMKSIQQEKSLNDNVPATEKQLGYLKRLRAEIPNELTKKQASRLIDAALADGKQAMDVVYEAPIRIP
jgi:hypothetical protein